MYAGEVEGESASLPKPAKPFSQWLYQSIAEPGVPLKVRLRGNNLHVLSQSQSQPDAPTIVERLLKALKSHTKSCSAVNPSSGASYL
jgi:hypothetical protein